jgi:tRNA(Ile)-lysidine synthase
LHNTLMNPMAKQNDKAFQKVREFIVRHAMLQDASGIVVAVSGGADSVTLLDMLLRLRELLKGQNPEKRLNLHVAHLNHLLRGEEAYADAEFVRGVATRLGVAVTIDSADVCAVAKALRKGIEETARELRYRFFVKVASEIGYNRIATGHTMNDQAETFVMRLARGAGLRGLAAMRPVVPSHQFDIAEIEAGKTETQEEPYAPNDEPQSLSSPLHLCASSSPLLLRPLLCVTRDEVEAYCLERRLMFRTDASNDSLSYTRNRVRHETLKALRSINPKAVERIARTAEILASEDDALEEAAQIVLQQAEVLVKGCAGDERELRKHNAYSIATLLNYSMGLRRRSIRAAIRQAREKNRQRKQPTSEITFVHLEAVENLLQTGVSGQRVMLPDGLEVWREFDALAFVYTEQPWLAKQDGAGREGLTGSHKPPLDGSEQEFSYEYWLGKEQPIIEVAGIRIRLSRRQPCAMLAEVLDEARLEKARSGSDWKTAALEDALLPEKLLIRPRKSGERVLVCGLRKIIKLKKLMIDHKIAPSRRASWPIVVTLDGEYVWSPGLPPALKFAAHDKTQSLAILRASDV